MSEPASDSNPMSPESPIANAGKAAALGSSGILIRLGILAALAVAAYFLIPLVLFNSFLAEENAKSKMIVVGNDSDMEPPPGTYIYGQSTPVGAEGVAPRRERPSAKSDDAAKDKDEDKTSEDPKPAKSE